MIAAVSTTVGTNDYLCLIEKDVSEFSATYL